MLLLVSYDSSVFRNSSVLLLSVNDKKLSEFYEFFFNSRNVPSNLYFLFQPALIYQKFIQKRKMQVHFLGVPDNLRASENE